MFKHILVPLDGSLLAERALAPATNFAEAMSAKLTLLRVVPQFAILAADPMLYEEMNRLGDEESLSYLRSKADALNLSVPINVTSETGQPADTIIQFAENHKVDLIMISSHGRSGLNRWVYGSVAERVMRQAPCATTIINARLVHELPLCRKILVPLDGSDLAERALEPGRQLAAAMGADLHLLRVATSAHQLMETSSMKEVFDEIEDKEVQEAETYLKSKYSDVSDGQVFIKVDVAKGTVAESIVNYAAEQQINMIVISSHGRTGLQRWVYGSVAEKVLRSACCATMIIREKAE
jgi:nucleotide-binding universal stress UspA family protein